MIRVYFLSPNLFVTDAIVAELQDNLIQKDNMHVVGISNLEIEKHKLPKATLKQITDFLPSIKKGALHGGIVGILSGTLIMYLSIENVEIGKLGVLGFGLLGLCIGAWSSSMIGVSVPNDVVVRFEDAISRGEYLLIVDVPKKSIKFLQKIIKQHHPDVVIYRNNT